jgi:hypothetical protein
MSHICQSTTVEVYVETFLVLMDQFSADGHHQAPLYYIIRFMDGLKGSVSLFVAIQMSKYVDERLINLTYFVKCWGMTLVHSTHRPSVQDHTFILQLTF